MSPVENILDKKINYAEYLCLYDGTPDCHIEVQGTAYLVIPFNRFSIII